MGFHAIPAAGSSCAGHYPEQCRVCRCVAADSDSLAEEEEEAEEEAEAVSTTKAVPLFVIFGSLF